MKFQIIGLGPGHRDYILPLAKRAIEEAQLIICAKRHEEAIRQAGLAHESTYFIHMEGQIPQIPEIIRGHWQDLEVAVVVSGDPGFYSLLKFLSKHFDRNAYEVIPGISSLQYAFMKVGIPHQTAYMGSVHGRETDIAEIMGQYHVAGFLTDSKWTPAAIADELIKNKIQDVLLHAGEHLSYDHERWVTGTPEEMKDQEFDALSVVIIERQDQK